MSNMLQDERQSEKASDPVAVTRKDTSQNAEETLVFC